MDNEKTLKTILYLEHVLVHNVQICHRSLVRFVPFHII